MDLQKKRENSGGEEVSNKKARTVGQPDFLSDGLNNDAIRLKVKDILTIIKDKKPKKRLPITSGLTLTN